MTERGDSILPTILSDGQEFFSDNKYLRELVETVVLTGADNPITREDLGLRVFDSRYSSDSHGKALNALIDYANDLLVSKKWEIKTDNLDAVEQKLWFCKVEDEPLVQSTSLITIDDKKDIVEVAEDLSKNFISRLSEIDKANIKEAMFRDPRRIREEIDGVSKMVALVREGKYAAPQASQLLEGTVQNKVDLVEERLKGLMALSIIDPGNKTVRTKFGWGRELNEMILFAGGGETGREVVFEALFGLNDVERALVLSQISMSKRYEILMVGLDQVNEREMAAFINSAVYKFVKKGDVDELELIITSISPRDNLDGFEAGRVIDAIVQNYASPDFIFQQLIEASKQADFKQELMELFSCSEITAPLLPKIENDDLGGSDIVKWNRRI